MSYRELLKEDYSYQQYNYFVALLVARNKKPFNILRIDNPDKTTVFIILTENTKSVVSTHRFKFSTADAVFFGSMIKNDFPSIDFQYIDKRTKED